jgi:Fur family ferric uptake transcriptional regulator
MKLASERDSVALARAHAMAVAEAWSATAFAQLPESPGAFVLSARQGVEVTALLAARVAADEAEILTLATVPEHRRQGLARRLLRMALDEAVAAGARTVFLEVAVGNSAALALYTSGGFVEVGRRARYYPGGGDALILRRDLNSEETSPYARGVDRLEKLCLEKGLRMTEQRRVVARVLSAASDHPDVEELHARAHSIDPHISIATVYRTVRLFEESGILTRHDFRQSRSRYEEAGETHHDHLIDMNTGAVVEFVDPEIEALQQAIARRLGYRLVDHRLELYGVRADD